MFVRRALLFVVLAVALSVAAQKQAFASVDLSFLGAGVNNLTDQSGDVLVPGTGYSTYDATAGTYGSVSSTGSFVGPGSILLSAFNITFDQYGANPRQDLSAYPQIDGIAAIQVLSVTATNGTFIYNFAPVSSGSVSLIGNISTAASAAVAGWNGQTMVSFYQGGTTPFNLNTTVNSTIGDVLTGATQLWQFGMAAGSLSQGWSAILPTNNVASSLLQGNNVGTVNVSLDLTSPGPFNSIVSPADLTSYFPPNSPVELLASTSFYGLTGSQPSSGGWDVYDLTTAEIFVTPEPASMCVWGGLLLFGAALVRRSVRRAR